ncbi:hypothetical protein GEOBRER4_n2228 [Citrifermentans bremense]|uniref:Glycine zipper 2TM domain-containing protein n=2 Tax=Geobacteraceae TaxID=213422 RepID=A0ABQ0MGK2_9BACT|nr:MULTISPECIES: hypothetical protein [Geobacteraceae]BCG47396.1 hypothetical protein GEOBRER4_n2228 [Citrifermentans bremense]GAW66229.1 hypothetical protein GPEL0_01f1502 [Geoanaerobacter pelophilus]
MNKLKRCIAIVVTLVFMATPCLAAENAFKTVFEDSMYGGLVGGLVGAALVVFTHKPADHLDYIAYGAAGGVLVGAAYGVASTSRSFAEIDNGKVKFAMPTVKPEFREGNVKGQTTLVAVAELIRGKF